MLIGDDDLFRFQCFGNRLQLDSVQPYFAALIVEDIQSDGNSARRRHTEQQADLVPLCCIRCGLAETLISYLRLEPDAWTGDRYRRGVFCGAYRGCVGSFPSGQSPKSADREK